MVLLIFLALSSTYSLRSYCQGESHSYSIRGSSDTSLQKIMRYFIDGEFYCTDPISCYDIILRYLVMPRPYAVQFHLFVTCVLFLSREGFWRACMRADIKCDGASTGENASKFLKVAWMTVPFGIVITVAACVLVFWWQELSYSNPYAQAILINGHAVTHVSRIRVQSFALNLKIRRGEEEEVATYLVHRLDMPKKKLVCRSEDARKSWKLGSCLTDALKLVLLIGTFFPHSL